MSDGKNAVSRPQQPASSAGSDAKPTHFQCSTLLVHDSGTGQRFLVDTGADISVLPASRADRTSRRSTAPLMAANGSAIRTYGAVSRIVVLNGRRFSHKFVVADVTKPILGADFFTAHKLLIDLAGRRLLLLASENSATPWILRAHPASISSAQVGLHQVRPSPFEAILDEFPEILAPKFGNHQNAHGVQHYIPTTGAPIHAKPRRLDPAKLAAAKAEFMKMVDAGICRPSSSPWSSPLHMVPKPDGSWRPCGNYRRLNNATVDDRYPLPNIQDFSRGLRGARVFSVVDLVRGYHQIPMSEVDLAKTAIVTPFGLFEFIRMPFGLKNSAQAFQRLMDTVLRDVPFAFVYLDDVLVASRDAKEHAAHLRALFGRLRDAGLAVNRAKCVLGATEVKFLGHQVTADGCAPLPKKIEAMLEMPFPSTKEQLQRFLGMANFYRRFLPGASVIMAPLHALVTATRAAKTKLAAEDLHRDAFRRTKSALANAVRLVHPDPEALLYLTTDASDVACLLYTSDAADE